MQDKNWPLNSYTNDTWTTVVDERAIIASILIANTSASNTPDVELRLDDGADNEVARVLPAKSIAVEDAQTLDLRSLVVADGQRLQMRANAAGLHILASGGA